MQFIMLITLIRTPFTSSSFQFIVGLSEIAGLDIFSVEGIHEEYLELKETSVLNNYVEELGIGSKNFMLTSGSIMLFAAIIIVQSIIY
jgi:hypothetical protein